MEHDVEALLRHAVREEEGGLGAAHEDDGGEIPKAAGEADGIDEGIAAVMEGTDEGMAAAAEEEIEETKIVIRPHGVDDAAEAAAQLAEGLNFQGGRASQIPAGEGGAPGETGGEEGE